MVHKNQMKICLTGLCIFCWDKSKLQVLCPGYRWLASIYCFLVPICVYGHAWLCVWVCAKIISQRNLVLSKAHYHNTNTTCTGGHQCNTKKSCSRHNIITQTHLVLGGGEWHQLGYHKHTSLRKRLRVKFNIYGTTFCWSEISVYIR